MGELRAGNRPDHSWNPEAIKGMCTFLKEVAISESIAFVGYYAIICSYDNLKELKNIRFISRIPDTFGITTAFKRKPFKTMIFEDVGILASKKTLLVTR